MWERFQRLLDRIESRVALWTIVQGGGIVSGGAISGWLSSGHAWIASHGAFGWWMAFLVGSLVTAISLAAFAGLRYLWMRGDAMRSWRERVKTVNPLAPEYHTERLSLRDIANPMNKRIRGKRFIDCEMMGPANLALIRNIDIDGTTFANCDFIAVKNNFPVHNFIGLEDVRIINGTIWECTILVPPAMVEIFANKGIQYLSPTGRQNVDQPNGAQG